MDPFEGRYRYCPKCRCEYRPGFDFCRDCGVDLVDELPSEGEGVEVDPDLERVQSWVGTDPVAAPTTPSEVDPDLERLQSWVGTDPVAVLTTPSEVDAYVARGLLIDAAIPCAVWGSGDGGYYGHLARLAAFPFRVMVHKDDEAEARELLASRFDGSLGE